MSPNTLLAEGSGGLVDVVVAGLEGDETEEVVRPTEDDLLESICDDNGLEPGSLDHASVTRVKADRMGIDDALACSVLVRFQSASNLYVQRNALTSLAFCGGLRALRYLCVAHNAIESLSGIEGLPQLRVLDASFNAVARPAAAASVPPSLRFLKLEGNPCCADADALMAVLAGLPNLRELDGRPIASGSQGDARGGAAAGSPPPSPVAVGALLRGGESPAAGSAPESAAQRREREIEEQIDREIELERAHIQVKGDRALEEEIARLKNALSTADEDGGGPGMGSEHNFRAAVDGLVHHARTSLGSKVDAMRERSRIRRLDNQEYSDRVSQEIAKLKKGKAKEKGRERPFSARGRGRAAER